MLMGGGAKERDVQTPSFQSLFGYDSEEDDTKRSEPEENLAGKAKGKSKIVKIIMPDGAMREMPEGSLRFRPEPSRFRTPAPLQQSMPLLPFNSSHGKNRGTKRTRSTGHASRSDVPIRQLFPTSESGGQRESFMEKLHLKWLQKLETYDSSKGDLTLWLNATYRSIPTGVALEEISQALALRFQGPHQAIWEETYTEMVQEEADGGDEVTWEALRDMFVEKVQGKRSAVIQRRKLQKIMQKQVKT